MRAEDPIRPDHERATLQLTLRLTDAIVESLRVLRRESAGQLGRCRRELAMATTEVSWPQPTSCSGQLVDRFFALMAEHLKPVPNYPAHFEVPAALAPRRLTGWSTRLDYHAGAKAGFAQHLAPWRVQFLSLPLAELLSWAAGEERTLAAEVAAEVAGLCSLMSLSPSSFRRLRQPHGGDQQEILRALLEPARVRAFALSVAAYLHYHPGHPHPDLRESEALGECKKRDTWRFYLVWCKEPPEPALAEAAGDTYRRVCRLLDRGLRRLYKVD